MYANCRNISESVRLMDFRFKWLYILFYSFLNLLCLPAVVSETKEEAFVLGSLREERGVSRLTEVFTGNLRLNYECVLRSQYIETLNTYGWSHDLGIDLQKVFSSGYRDIGTFNFAGSCGKIDNLSSNHGHGGEEGSWSWNSHLANFRYNGFGHGNMGVTVGMFEVPFGLEPSFDTHFQLRELMSASNVGLRDDWGVSIDRYGDRFEYEFAVMRGSGIDYRRVTRPSDLTMRSGKENWAVSGRVGTPGLQNFSNGFSVYHGEIPRQATHMMSSGHMDGSHRMPTTILQRRTRFAYDATLVSGPFSYYGEFSIGRNFDASVRNALTGVEWYNRDGSVVVYIQGIYLSEELEDSAWDDSLTSQFGMQYELNQFLIVGLQCNRVYDALEDESEVTSYQLQLRFVY